MKLESVEIRNYRILQNLNFQFEDNVSLVIGKNNSGKTSFLSILDKFLTKSKYKNEFHFEDFSIDSQSEILELEESNLTVESYVPIGISLKMIISYNEDDNIGNASVLLLDLDDKNNRLVALLEYSLSYEKYLKLKVDFAQKKSKNPMITFEKFLKKNINHYFTVGRKALEFQNEEDVKILQKDALESIITFETIGAKRDVDNLHGHSNSLSKLATKYYDSYRNLQSDFVDLENELENTDKNLTTVYKELFRPIVDEIASLSYNPQDAELEIISILSERNLFQDNTVVKYKHDTTLLPEDYNGLGYLNLFAMIFGIRIKLDYLSKKNNTDEVPTPINILFIEEPEAHTHPQMQYVFIRNIKKVLKSQQGEIGENFSLQTVISTHSAHIVSKVISMTSVIFLESRN